MAPRLLVIGAGWEQRPLVERALVDAFDVAAAGPPESEVAPLVSVYAAIDPRDLPGLLRFATEVEPSAIVSDQDDYARYAQAWLCERLRLPGPVLDAVAPTTMKHLLRDLCRSADVPQPEYRVIHSLGEARTAVDGLPWPIIVKPVDNRGSFGVVRIDEPRQLSEAVSDALAHSHSRTVLLEEFIHGTVVTVDGAYLPQGHRVLGVASKRQAPGRRQVAMELCYPAQLPAHAVARATANANAVAAVLEARGATGLSHTEFVFDGEELWLLESANRGGGVHTSSVILPEHSGFDTSGFLLAEASGTAAAEWQVREPAPCVLLSFIPLSPGVVSDVRGFEQVSDAPGVLKARLSVRPGDVVGDIENAVSRAGFVIVSAQDPDAAHDHLRQALEHLEVSYA